MNDYSERGQALVELTLSLSLLFLIILGIVEFGRIGHAFLVTTHASREGARVGALRYSDAQISERVWDAASSLNLQSVVVSITPSQSLRHRGDSLEVLVLYEVPLITPFGAVLPDPFPVRARTTMRVE